MWVKGDMHVHSHCCGDGKMAVNDIVEHAREYCDFLAISGHCRVPEFFRAEAQYKEVLAAREKFNMPIFNTGEIEFPIPRHVIVFTTPDDREFELLQSLVPRFCRRNGVEGMEKALEELAFIQDNWHDNVCMIFNHPNAPDVATEDLMQLAQSDVFRVLACVDRGERRAPQTWDVNGAWDQLLMNGFKISTRCGSDFHGHLSLGGKDYYPGEFVQDVLQVGACSYQEILQAYRKGNFYTTVGNLISDPVFTLKEDTQRMITLEFDLNGDVEFVEVISEGKVVEHFTDVACASGRFAKTVAVPNGKYYRVRGAGKLQKRKYTEGEFEPLFLLNPIYC